VILFGDEPGTAALAEELNLTHVPVIACSPAGTPLISAMFESAEALTSDVDLCLINADVILTSDFTKGLAAVRDWSPRAVVVGQRIDIELRQPIDWGLPDWESDIRRLAQQQGRRQSEISIDWIAFPKGALTPIPDFAIGRLWYDNWLVWHAADRGLPVVDATDYIHVIHQRHDYSHKGGKAAIFEGPEARRNYELIGHWSHWHSVAHARWMLTPAGVVTPARGMKYALARPRRLASHALRFTRPIRRRLQREPSNELR